MTNYLLVINAGSSSIKFTIYQVQASGLPLHTDAVGQIEGIGNQPFFTVKNTKNEDLANCQLSVNEGHQYLAAVNCILSWLWDYVSEGVLIAVGHRVVHGGLDYSSPVLIDANILASLETLVPLAPLHQPQNLIMMRVLMETKPSLPQVACFDTAFHATRPSIAKSLAIPRHYTDAGIHEYGFHGLSYEYIASVLPTLAPPLADARIIVAHLGSGASLCAMQGGRSVATTMGFSPLNGLVMGTRCGNIDPGVLLYLMDRYHMDARALEHLLYFESGLLGVSGISNDMRILLASTDPHAQEAIELFVYRICREIGSLSAALGGLDALVFTGGIGEHSALIRAKVCQHSQWLGLNLDQSANETAASCISRDDSKVSAWVVPTDENMMIALHTIRQVRLGE